MIRKHAQHVALSIGLMAIGLYLMTNDRFFIWPPDALELINDDVWGAVLISIGVGIMIWVFEGGKSVKWNSILLTLAAGALAALAVYQFSIEIATGVHYDWISKSILTAFVLNMARRSDVNDRPNH